MACAIQTLEDDRRRIVVETRDSEAYQPYNLPVAIIPYEVDPNAQRRSLLVDATGGRGWPDLRKQDIVNQRPHERSARDTPARGPAEPALPPPAGFA